MAFTYLNTIWIGSQRLRAAYQVNSYSYSTRSINISVILEYNNSSYTGTTQFRKTDNTSQAECDFLFNNTDTGVEAMISMSAYTTPAPTWERISSITYNFPVRDHAARVQIYLPNLYITSVDGGRNWSNTTWNFSVSVDWEDGILHISDGTQEQTYQMYISSGVAWEAYQPHISSGTSWEVY